MYTLPHIYSCWRLVIFYYLDVKTNALCKSTKTTLFKFISFEYVCRQRISVTCRKKSLFKKSCNERKKQKENVIMLSSCNVILVRKIKFNFVFFSTFWKFFFSIDTLQAFSGPASQMGYCLSFRYFDKLQREGEELLRKTQTSNKTNFEKH